MSRNSGLASTKMFFTRRVRLAGWIVALLANAVFFTSAWALPRAELVPGGVAVFPLRIPKNSEPPQVFYEDQRVMVLQNEGRWYAVAGIPLGAKPGRQQLILKRGNIKEKIPFSVKAKRYLTQRLTVPDKMVEPSPEDLVRIGKEKAIIGAAFQQWTDQSDVVTGFLAPTEGPMSSSFGLRRVFNGEVRTPHSGMDIAAPMGAPVVAPSPGKVIEIGEFYFTGNTVFIDHGQGLISMLCHLSDVAVTKGQAVNPGDLIGHVGQTGRATGPHLHWAVSLNNARVNPHLFIKLTPKVSQK